MAMDNGRRSFIKKGSIVTGSVIGFGGCLGDDGGDPDDTDGQDGGNTQGGFPEPEDDVEYEEVPELEFTIQSRNEDAQAYEEATLAADHLENLGFAINPIALEASAWGDRFYEQEWDFTHLGWGGSPVRMFPHYMLYASFHSSNDVGWRVKTHSYYDDVVSEFAQAMERQERVELAKRCQRVLAQNQPALFTVHINTLAAYNSELQDDWEPMVGERPYYNLTPLMNLTDPPSTVVMGKTQGLDPYPNILTFNGRPFFTHKLYYDTFVELDLTGDIIPRAATDWTAVDDTTVDVTLRQNMTFHDGEPVTTEGVAWSWEFLDGNVNPWLQVDLDPIDRVEAIDDEIIRFHLEAPTASFIPVSLYKIPILPRHIWEGIAEEEGLEHPNEWSEPDMTGSGPFQFIEFKPQEEVIVEKYDGHYWSDEINFDRFVRRVYGSQAPIIEDLSGGTIQMTDQLGPTHWNRADDDENITAISSPNIGTEAVWAEFSEHPNGLWQDVRGRQALSHAIDKQEIKNVVYQGRAELANQNVAPANETYYAENTPEYNGGIDEAVSLLADMGYRWNEDGRVLRPVGWEPEVTYVDENGDPLDEEGEPLDDDLSSEYF